MVIYNIELIYEARPKDFPPFKWQQQDDPDEEELNQMMFEFANKNNIPLDFLEDKGVLLVSAEENGMHSEPEPYGIDFSKYKK